MRVIFVSRSAEVFPAFLRFVLPYFFNIFLVDGLGFLSDHVKNVESKKKSCSAICLIDLVVKNFVKSDTRAG